MAVDFAEQAVIPTAEAVVYPTAPGTYRSRFERKPGTRIGRDGNEHNVVLTSSNNGRKGRITVVSTPISDSDDAAEVTRSVSPVQSTGTSGRARRKSRKAGGCTCNWSDRVAVKLQGSVTLVEHGDENDRVTVIDRAERDGDELAFYGRQYLVTPGHSLKSIKTLMGDGVIRGVLDPTCLHDKRPDPNWDAANMRFREPAPQRAERPRPRGRSGAPRRTA
jgi:hypothetical protein